MKETLKKMAFGNFLSLVVWNMGVMALADKSKAPLIRFVLFKNVGLMSRPDWYYK